MLHTSNGKLLSNRKDETADTHKTQIILHGMMLHEKNPKGYIIYDSIYLIFLKITKLQKWRTDYWFPGAKEGMRWEGSGCSYKKET